MTLELGEDPLQRRGVTSLKIQETQVNISSLGFGFIRHDLNNIDCLGKENTGKSS